MGTIRYGKFKNEEVKKLLEEKKEIVEVGNKLVEKYKKIENELEKSNQKIQKIKDQLRPLVDPYIKEMNLAEFEIPTEVKVVEDEIEVSIVDQVESYKELLRNKKEDEHKGNSDSNKDAVEGTN